MPQDMPPKGGYEAVQFKVSFVGGWGVWVEVVEGVGGRRTGVGRGGQEARGGALDWR